MLGGTGYKSLVTDYDMIFHLWILYGTLSRVSYKLTSEGVLNYMTGKSITQPRLNYIAVKSYAKKAYLKKREDNPEMSRFPTEEEMRESQAYYDQNFEKFKEAMKKLYDEYAEYRQVREKYYDTTPRKSGHGRIF